MRSKVRLLLAEAETGDWAVAFDESTDIHTRAKVNEKQSSLN